MLELLHSSYFTFALEICSTSLFIISIITILVLIKIPKKKHYALVASASIIIPIAIFIFVIFGNLSNYINATREVNDGVKEVSENVKETAVVERGKTYDICYFINNSDNLKYVNQAHINNSTSITNDNYTINDSNKSVTILDTCQTGESLNIYVYGTENNVYNIPVTLEVVD